MGDILEGMEQVELFPSQVALNAAQPKPLLVTRGFGIDDLPLETSRVNLSPGKECSQRLTQFCLPSFWSRSSCNARMASLVRRLRVATLTIP